MRVRWLGALFLLLAALGNAHAQTDLIQDSGFNTSNGTTITTGFQPDYNGTLDNWSNSNAGPNGGGPGGIYGYNFVFTGGGGAQTVSGDSGNLSLFNVYDGGSSTWNGAGPLINGTYQNYIAADGAYQTGALTQDITGLVVGTQYKIQFDYAGAQQTGFTGATSEAWKVALGDTLASSISNVTGSSPFETSILQNANHGFTGWVQASFYFTADATSEYLAFLAVGTPNGEPPFTLLADPTLFIPEPGAASLLALGAGALAAARSRRRPLVGSNS